MEDDYEVDPEMTAAMGFSSFGAQPNAKKRKYHHDDAVVSIDDPRGKSSGANTIELGIRKQRDESDSGVPPQPKSPEPVSTARDASITHPAGASAGLSQFISEAQSLPPRPMPPGANQNYQIPTPSASDPKSFPGGIPKQFFDKLDWKELEALRKGVKDENGDIAYFLPSFIEDPWAKLEREQGGGS
jgi:hypothetical protein